MRATGKILSNVSHVIRQPKYAAIAVMTSGVVAFIYSLAYGMISIPFVFANLRMTPLQLTDYLFIMISSAVIGIILSLSVYSRDKKNLAGKSISFASFGAGFVGAVCPVCLGLNLLVFGTIVTTPLLWLIPYIGWVQVAVFALLGGSFWLSARNAYDNYCLSCKINQNVKRVKKETDVSLLSSFNNPQVKYALYGIFALAILFLVVQVVPLVGAFGSPITGVAVASKGNSQIDLQNITAQVLPENGFTIDAKWGDTISKMVKAGVLDANKLDSILTNRYGQPLTEEQKNLLAASYSDEKLTINSKNAVFMMYILWALAKDNDNSIQKESPFAQYFANYDIGVGKAGYADTKLLDLTPEQQEIAKTVALNSYRPCCGNPTGWPDCSHGFSALGLVELMASQGFSKAEIFDAFVKFNSFWFPSTYIQDAIYFKVTENKDWNSVDKELVAGKQYSSLSGSYAVKNYLQGLGL